ncbi:hypothetical protein [Bradyrhizobium uaiense]|uniref:Secreted protein n=1 Tax=Bradyrhizobium uaiense TaxID=2594946 RepID=A0A6P1BHI9_9BRAD|nr:hypothetical protein [Bradyrhizobium uaiense]NEU97689.1 hypothetical protein [Bradyrhizobium uaiense]
MLRAGWRPVVALTVLGTIGLAAVATADPIEPSKIRTIRIAPQSADDRGDPSTTPPKYNRLHVLTVRPRLPDEHRDAAGREWPTTTTASEPAADAHAVRTTPVRPEHDATHDATGRAWSATPGLVSPASNPHQVRSLRIRSEQTDPNDRYRRFAPEALEPSQAVPQ